MAQDQGRPVPPPADLNKRKLRLADVSPQDWRLLFASKHDACYYSPSPNNRFSSATCPVLYFGNNTVTLFWEIFWDDLGPLAKPDRLLSKYKLIARDLVGVNAKRTFKVFDATNAQALKAVSATPGTFTGDYTNCQAWAVALLNHPE